MTRAGVGLLLSYCSMSSFIFIFFIAKILITNYHLTAINYLPLFKEKSVIYGHNSPVKQVTVRLVLDWQAVQKLVTVFHTFSKAHMPNQKKPQLHVTAPME